MLYLRDVGVAGIVVPVAGRRAGDEGRPQWVASRAPPPQGGLWGSSQWAGVGGGKHGVERGIAGHCNDIEPMVSGGNS